MAKVQGLGTVRPSLAAKLRCLGQDLWLRVFPEDLTTAVSIEFPTRAWEVELTGPLFSAAECLMADRNADGSWRVVRRSYDLDEGNGLYRYDTLVARTRFTEAVAMLQRFEANHPHRLAYRYTQPRRPDAEGYGPPHVSRVVRVKADKVRAMPRKAAPAAKAAAPARAG